MYAVYKQNPIFEKHEDNISKLVLPEKVSVSYFEEDDLIQNPLSITLIKT